MSMENVKKFLELVKTDEGLARKVVELKDNLQKSANLGSEVEILAEKVLPLAKAHGLEFTTEEFLVYANSVSGELSEDDLLNVSGGLSARSVALGLLFATGLSFVPTFVLGFATPETSTSQSDKSEREEALAMELKEREAEKEVRSSREGVRRAGDQLRAAQKRVDTLRSKLPEHLQRNELDEINSSLTKKEKKKISKLINQIAMAEADLKAAKARRSVAKGKTATAEEAKSEVKKKNADAIKERKEREKIKNNKKQFSETMKELLKAKKEQQAALVVSLGDNKLEEKHEERQDEINERVKNKEDEIQKKKEVVEEKKDEVVEKSEEQLRLSAKQNNETKISADTILNENAEYQQKGYHAFLSAEEYSILNSATRNDDELNKFSEVLKNINDTIESRQEKAALSVKVIEKINERLASCTGEDDEPYRLTLTARKGEISMGKTADGNVITVEDLKKDLEELGFDELKEARIKQIDKLLTKYGNTMSAKNKTMLEKQKKNISEDKMNKQALTGLENTLKSIEANLQKEADVKEKKGALQGKLSYLYNTQAKADLKGELDAVNVNSVTSHNYEELSYILNEIEKKIVEAEQQQKDKIKDLSKELNEIDDTINGLSYEDKDTDALSQKYSAIKAKMNSGEFDLTQVEIEIKELKELVEQVDKGTKNLKQVKFAGEARSWDGTIENLYNCLKDADFDTDRIENLDEWQESCEKALKTMTVYNDTLQIYQWTGTSCGSNVKDYKHKAMLKTLALFAMELEGEVEEGKAKDFIDKVTQVKEKKIEIIATADDVKVDDRVKAFVEGKK